MNAVSVHGGGEVFDKISFSEGRFAEHDAACRVVTVMGVGRDDVASSPDIVPSSSSASQSAGAGLRDRDEDIEETGEKGTDGFFLSMPLRKLFLFPFTTGAQSSTGVNFG